MECTSGVERVMECTGGARYGMYRRGALHLPFFHCWARYGMYRRGALWNVPKGRVMECTKISLLGAAALRPPLKQMVDIFRRHTDLSFDFVKSSDGAVMHESIFAHCKWMTIGF